MNGEQISKGKHKNNKINNQRKQKNRSNGNGNSQRNIKKAKGHKNPPNVQGPRPNNLLNGIYPVAVNGGSGSEIEDFQTPSIEYDIINETFNGCDVNYEKEWEEIGIFPEDGFKNLDELVPKKDVTEIISEKVINYCDADEKNEHATVCNGGLEDVCKDEDNKMTKDPFTDCSEKESIPIQPQFPQNTSIEDSENIEEYHSNNEERDILIEIEEESANPSIEDVAIINPIAKSPTLSSVSGSKLASYAVNPEVTNLKEITISDIIETFEDTCEDKIECEEDGDSFNSMPYIRCTDENLSDEILIIKYVVNGVIRQPLIKKSLSLSRETSEYSYKRSTATITNVTSISDASIPINVDDAVKDSKKSKFMNSKIVKSVIKRFRKKKIPDKESPQNAVNVRLLQVQPEGRVKASEIGSNQSLNSPDCSEKISEKVTCPCSDEACIKDFIVNNKDEEVVETNIAVEAMEINGETRCENRMEPNTQCEIIKESKAELIKESSLNKNSSVICTTKDISDESRAKVNSSTKIKSNRDPCRRDSYDEHLHQDPITSTEIIGIKPTDIPFFDDPDISELDSMSVYFGESKRLQAMLGFKVPMASMESLYFTDEPAKATEIPKLDIPESKCERKHTFWDLLGCLSRRR